MQIDLNNATVQNVMIRQKAKEIWQENKGRLLLMTLCVYGVVFGLEYLVSLLAETQSTVQPLSEGLKISYSFGNSLITWGITLLTPPLMLGLLKC